MKKTIGIQMIVIAMISLFFADIEVHAAEQSTNTTVRAEVVVEEPASEIREESETSAETGDDNHLLFHLVSAGSCAVIVLGLSIGRRKKQNQRT